MAFIGKSRAGITMALLALILAACGGGDPATQEAPPAPPLSSDMAAQPPQAAVARTPSATALMDWAQTRYAQHFPGRKGNFTSAPYLLRYYPETGNYLGAAGDAVYIYGPVSGNQLTQVGRLSDFSCSVYPASCSPGSADTRNGTYTLYATTGERFTLQLDFDQRQFFISSPQTTFVPIHVAGTFSADTVAGSYVFQGTSGSGVTTRFRYVDDLIVGSFTFETGVRPFVASRNFAQSYAEAQGTYSNFGINRSAGADDSRIYTSRITAANTLEICNNNTIYAMEKCPAATILTYTLSLNGDLFTAQNGTDSFSFRVAKAGNEQIFLMGAINQAAGTRFFRIGLAESATFGSGSATGGSTLGEWGTANYTTSSYASSGSALDGRAISLAGSLTSMGTIGPANMRSLQSGGNAFVMQNTQLGILIGARNSTGAGYMQIGAR